MVLIIRKFIIYGLVIISLMLSLIPDANAFDADTNAASAIVMHGGGEVIYEKNADDRRLIASTTKIMTAILAIESGQLDEEFTVSAAWCGIEGSSMYLRVGQILTLRQLVEGLLLTSGNDAAIAIACAVSGDIDSFAALMNEKAHYLGMDNSHFDNPHGLDSEEHYSTARDMAKLMIYCMDNPEFCDIIGERSATVADQTYYNHNKLLSRCEGCIGGKTGYTMAAGRCLVSCCERDGTRYVCVTLNDPNDWDDHCALYNQAFSEYSDRVIVSKDDAFDVPYANIPGSIIKAVPKDELRIFMSNDSKAVLSAELPFMVIGPVFEGQYAGTVSAYVDGQYVGSVELVYNESKDVLRQILSPEFYMKYIPCMEIKA